MIGKPRLTKFVIPNSLNSWGKCFCFCVCISCATVITGCTTSEDPSAKSSPPAKAASETNGLAEAKRLLESGDLEAASKLIQRSLLEDPNRDEAKLVAAQIDAAQGNDQASIDLVASINLRSPFGKRALDLRMNQLAKLGRTSEAADVLLRAIDEAPLSEADGNRWRHDAWRLLSRVGRRQEASQQVDILCRSGQANRFELLSLARRNDAYPWELEQKATPAKHFEPGLGIARWYYTQHDFRRALRELSPQFETEFESPAAEALYGRLLVENQDLHSFSDWYSNCDERVQEFSDYWIALGTYFLHHHQYEPAARALLEGSVRDPTDYACVSRLATVFLALEQHDKSEQFRHRGALIYQVEHLAKEMKPGPIQPNGVPRLLLELGRPFEAIGWTLLALPESNHNARVAVIQKLQQLRSDPSLFKMASEMSLVGIKPSTFRLEPALADLRKSKTKQAKARNSDQQLAVPRLVNVAPKVGLEFQWHQDVKNGVDLIPLHELMGGGIAVIDFDLDGWPDVYLAQGAGEPPSSQCVHSSLLFRNINSRFQTVGSQAGTDDRNYSSGIAVGDVNQDGFPDLYLGSLGRNRLLINNGDGTFNDATPSLGKAADCFTSSLAIADINGDSIPDLFEAVYVEMDGGFDPPEMGEDGHPMQPAPILHYAQTDRWFENLGNASFRMHEISREIADPGTSLGVVVTDLNNNGRNDVFVGNDARSNHLLVQTKNNEFQNSAAVSGIASGFSGEAEACMGIATGDFNRDGSIDLHISNYDEESANHYLQRANGAFADLAIQYGIDQPTRSQIGFGVKAVDVDRNGWLDLLVSNGHVFDLRLDGEKFRMPPQFLSNLGDRFELVAVDDASGYWEEEYLGRSVATIDFNRDGAIDFLVGHLHKPLALLRNETRTEGKFVQFELVGTLSERDAIGARVTVKMESGESFTQWCVAGDGYLCSDESIIDFGLGPLERILEVNIAWPSGANQTFDDVTVGHRYLVVEEGAKLYKRGEH